MVESFDINDWLVQTLGADDDISAGAGGRICPDMAPLGAQTPYILYSQQSAVDLNSIGLERATTRAIYLVRAVDKGESYTTLRTLVTAIDRVLHGTVAVLPSCRITVSRMGDYQFPELANDVRYMHKGGLYNIVVQPDDGPAP